jgi:hypothetical protein
MLQDRLQREMKNFIKTIPNSGREATKKPHLLSKGRPLMDLPGFFFPLFLEMIQAVAMPLAMQLDMLALRLHKQMMVWF